MDTCRGFSEDGEALGWLSGGGEGEGEGEGG
jgi:hypothetical protein